MHTIFQTRTAPHPPPTPFLQYLDVPPNLLYHTLRLHPFAMALAGSGRRCILLCLLLSTIPAPFKNTKTMQ